MVDPLTYALVWWQRWGAIVGGLIVGTLAKYGLTLNEGRPLSWRGFIADMCLLGILGVIAIVIADWFNLQGEYRVLSGALAAVSSDRLVRLARDRFLQKAEAQLTAVAIAAPGAAMVPAGSGEPDAICAQPGTPDNPKARAGTALRSGFGAVKRPPDDMIEALRDMRE